MNNGRKEYPESWWEMDFIFTRGVSRHKKSGMRKTRAFVKRQMRRRFRNYNKSLTNIINEY